MRQYHKIKTLWKREDKKPHNMMVGTFAEQEFEDLQNHTWIGKEKIDGTNIRIMWDGQKVRIGGKTDNAQIPTMLYDYLTDTFLGEHNEQKFEEVFGESEMCLYGEGCGAKIQKGGGNYMRDGNIFVLFDVKIGDAWLRYEDVQNIADKFDIRFAKVVKCGTLQQLSDFVAQGFNSEFGDFLSEGIVAVPKGDFFTRTGKRIITKIKHKDFLKL